MINTCKECGLVFKVYKEQPYCTRTCSGLARRKRNLAKRIPENNGEHWLIPLNGNRFTKVCHCHFHLVKDRVWQYSKRGYAERIEWESVETQRTIKMHRLISGAGTDFVVDHINGDALDNRCCNLRICSHANNCRNTRQRSKNNTSGYKGVSWNKRRNKWYASVMFNYESIHCGVFDTKEEAALAYNQKAYELFGEFARLNILPKTGCAENFIELHPICSIGFN